MKYLILFFGLFFSHSIHPEGFVADTPVETEQGYVSIQKFKEGDKVLSYGFDGNLCVTQVIQLCKRYTESIVKITFDNEIIFTAPDQPFILTTPSNHWLVAADLKDGDVILSESGKTVVKSVDILAQSTETYTLSVAEYGNFCVSKHNIFTHNFVEIGVVLAYGGGYVVVEKITAAVCWGTAALCGAWLVKKSFSEAASRQSNYGYRGQWDPNQLYYNPCAANGPNRNNNRPNNPNKGKNKTPHDPDIVQHKKQGQTPSNYNPKKLASKERKFNTMERAEVFRKGKFKQDYKTCGNGRYEKKDGADGFGKRAQYLEWDNLHKDVEAYDKFGRHQGSIDPATEKMYKPAEPGRTIDMR